MATEPAGTGGAASAQTAIEETPLRGGRVFHDPSIPELLCRYPNEPTVEVLEQHQGELLVSLNGRHRRVTVRNPELAEVGRQYYFIREGADQGLWQLPD